MTRAAYTLPVLAALAFVGHAYAAQPLGRLFFTPAERAQLDVARVQKHVPPAAPAQQADAPSAPQVITYSGIVRRSDGKATLWLNNKPVDEKEGLSGLAVKGKVNPDGRVTLRVPETGTSIELKVGQSAELQTGRVGELRREPAAPKDDSAKAEARGKEDSPQKGDAAAKRDAPQKSDAAKADAPQKAEATPAPAKSGDAKADAPAPTASRDGASHAEMQQRAAREKK
jgi:hypothetical protein